MPIIMRARFINVGHRAAFFEDLLLDLVSYGANGFILASNGTGKSSLIGLMLNVIRPNSYEFLRGEVTNKKRELREYISEELPSTVLIEWVMDDNREEKNLLCTGVTYRLKPDKTINRFFYSFEYPLTHGQKYLTIESFPYTTSDDDGERYLQFTEIKKYIRERKDSDNLKQRIFTTTNQDNWITNLQKYFIDSELYRMQSMMNQREGAQNEFMEFGNEMEFILSLVNILRKPSDPETEEKKLAGIENLYREIKDLPKNQEEKDYFARLIPEFEKGAEIGGKLKQHQEMLREKQREWSLLNSTQIMMTSLGEELLEGRVESIKTAEHELSEVEETNHTLQRVVGEVQYVLTKKRYDTNKESIAKLEAQQKSLERLTRISYIYRMYHDMQTEQEELKRLNTIIHEKSIPQWEQLQAIGKKYLTALYNEKGRIKTDMAHTEDSIKKLESRVESINKQLGGIESEITNSDASLKNLSKRIEEIEEKEKGVSDILIGTVQETETQLETEINTLEIEVETDEKKVESIQVEVSQIHQRIT